MVRPASCTRDDQTSETIRLLKCTLAVNKDGVRLRDIDSEFEHHVGKPIEYPTLKYRTVHEFIRGIKEIRITKNRQGDLVYVLGDNAKVAHLTDLIRKQKEPRSKSARGYRNRSRDRKATSRTRHQNRHDAYNTRREIIESDDSGNPSTEAFSDDYSERYTPPTITSPPKRRNIVQTPLVSAGQLIGDDFFLQLAIRNLRQPIWRGYKNAPLHCGLCVSGQTIRGCTKSLKDIDVMSNKVVIMLGAEDIYKGKKAKQMQEDYEELLEVLSTKFAFSTSAITLCTLPPLGNVSWIDYPDKFAALHTFNDFIVQTAINNGYQVVDFFNHFSTVHKTLNEDLFQIEPRRVSGTSHSYLLFSDQGRRLAMTLLRHTVE